jgi:hypothetical protein
MSKSCSLFGAVFVVAHGLPAQQRSGINAHAVEGCEFNSPMVKLEAANAKVNLAVRKATAARVTTSEHLDISTPSPFLRLSLITIAIF